MADFNKFLCLGWMANDPEMKETRNGKDYARFRLSYNRGWGDNKQSHFVTCQAYGNQANYIVDYGAKGRRVFIEGELIVLDQKDGDAYKTSVFINVRSLEFCDRPEDKGKGKSKADDADDFPSAEYGDDEDDDDIPF